MDAETTWAAGEFSSPRSMGQKDDRKCRHPRTDYRRQYCWGWGWGYWISLRLLTTTHENLCTFVIYRYGAFVLGCCEVPHEASYFCVLDVVICMQELMRETFRVVSSWPAKGASNKWIRGVSSQRRMGLLRLWLLARAPFISDRSM